MDRSKWHGVPTKFVLSSSFELGSFFDDLGGIEIGTRMGFDRDVVLVITTYTDSVLWLPLPYGCGDEGAGILNEPNCRVER